MASNGGPPLGCAAHTARQQQQRSKQQQQQAASNGGPPLGCAAHTAPPQQRSRTTASSADLQEEYASSSKKRKQAKSNEKGLVALLAKAKKKAKGVDKKPRGFEQEYADQDSDGGEDATVLREFDMSTKSFVDGGFVLDQKSQGGIQWLDQDTLLVSRDFGEGTLTESQYPRTTRVWKRGTPIDQAEEIWRGEEADVWSGATLLRDHTGTVHGTYAFRATSFHETEYFWQKDGETAWWAQCMPLPPLQAPPPYFSQVPQIRDLLKDPSTS